MIGRLTASEIDRPADSETGQTVLASLGGEQCRSDIDTEVRTDVEMGKLGIDIGIDDGDEVYADEAEDAEVALAAVVVLAVLEYALEVVLVGLHVVAWGQEVLVAGGTGVVVHDVEVGL